MGDIEYLISIVAKLRDEASPKIAALKAELDKLKGTQDTENAEKDLGKAIKDTGDEADKSKRKHESLRSEHERSSRAADDAGRGTRKLSEDVERSGRSHDKAADSVGGHTQAQKDFADALSKVRREQEDTASGAEDLRKRTSELHSAWNDFESDLNRGSFSKGEATRGLKEFSSEFTSLSRKLQTGGQDWKDTEATLDRIAGKLKNPDLASTGGLARSVLRTITGSGDEGRRSSAAEAIESIDSKVGDLGIRITGVASALQGFFDLAKIGLSQQLITGVLSLAGGLVSVASAAAQAGAALAGAFISGVGQAIPMLAVVAASLERFKNILQAVSVAGQAEQQHFYDPTEKQVTQLQNVSQLISSQQQLSNSYTQVYEAQQRVRDSQISLTEARYTAQRQITELANAEKNARLEAEGANLSLTESKRQLQIAIQKGDTAGLQQAELAVKEAELSKRTTEYAVPKAEREARLARERGVSGAPSVISAVEGLEGAKVAQLQAQQAGEAAKRQEEITKLQQASRSSKETTYESQLKFLKKGMSPTELGLTDALIGLEKELKSPDSPLKKITDYFVEPFADAVEKIRSLLGNADFLKPIDALAKAMGAGFGRLEKSTYGSEGTSFFESMAKDATSNIPIVSQAIERIMKLFEDIAKAADPAFHKLSEDWDRFWGTLDKRYEGEGLTRLEQFFNKSTDYAEKFAHLGKAVIDLFLALGHDAAPQGLDTVTTFTGSIEAATKWVKENTPEVTKFFREAREGLSLIGQMLGAIGLNLLKAFSLSSLTAFSRFISEILLPALKDVVNILGWITKALLNIANAIPGGKSVLEGITGLFLGIIGIAKIAGPIMEAVKALQALYKATKALMLMEGVSKAWSDAKGVFTATGGAAADAAKVTGAATATEGGEAVVAEGEVATANAGLITLLPEITAAAAVVAGAYGAVKGLEALGIFNSKSYEKPGTRISATPGKPARSEEEVERYTLEGRTNVPKPQAYGKTALGEIGRNPANTQFEEALEIKRDKTNPILTEVEKNFGKLLNAVGPIFPKIADIVEENSEHIRKSLGEKSLQAKEALKTNFSDAITWIEASMKRGKIATAEGMEDIRKLLSKELKAYGVNPASINKAASVAGGIGKSAAKGLEGFASGGYIPAQPGGRIARVAEAGHDEVVLSTDPAHATRSRALLGQYFSRAPHMAAGGFVADPGTNFTVNQEPKIVTELRKLGEYLGTTIYGISGYRSPSHSVAVGGFSNDPHTRGEAADIGVGSDSRESASRLTAALLAKFDLYRPFYPASAAEINHVQLLSGDVSKIVGSSPGAIGKMVEQVGGAAQNIHNIIAPKISGGGGIGKVAQKALDLTTKAANIYLEKYASPVASASSMAHDSATAGKLGPANKAEFVRYLSQYSGLPAKFLGAWVNHEQGSSTVEGGNNWLNIETGGPGGGSGPYGATAKWVERHTPKVAAAIEYEWLQNNLPQLLKAKNAEEAVMILENSGYAASHYNHESAQGFLGAYATGGLIGDSVRRLAVRHLRKKVLKFANGGRAPWGGKPVPAILHEGERVLNPAQYGETARLAGTSPVGLDRHLGYDSSPRQHFADGGLISRNPRGVAQPITTGSAFEPNLIGQVDNVILESNNYVKLFKKIKQAFSKLKKTSGDKFTKDLEKIIGEIIVETNGVLAKMQEGREFFKSKLERKSVEGEYTKKGGKIELGSKGEAGVAEGTLKVLSGESKYLQEERKLIDQSIAKEKSLKPKNQKERNNKSEALHALALKQKELGEVIDQNIEARYQAEVQVLQDKITEANNQFQVTSQEQTAAVSSAQGLGNLGEVGGIEQQIRKTSENQLTTLAPLLKEAESLGNKELASTIKQEMVSLRQTITNSIVENFSNAQTLIQRESQRAETSSGEKLGLGKVFAQEGNYAKAGEYEKRGLEEKGNNLQSSYNQRKSLYFEASEKGDTAAMITLYEELQKNTVEIAENNLALKDNVTATRELTLGQIQRQGALGTGIYGAAKQGLELIGQTTGYTNVSGLLGAAKGEKGVLTTEQAGIEKEGKEIGLNTEGKTAAQILTYLQSPEAQQLMSKIETTGNEAEKQHLEKVISALTSNSTAILQNTEEIAKLNGQLNQPQSWSTSAWSQFRGAAFNGMGGLLPSYSSSLPPGAMPTEMPKYGEMAPGASRASTIGTLNMTHPVQPLDPQLLGEQLSHAIATSPTM